MMGRVLSLVLVASLFVSFGDAGVYGGLFVFSGIHIIHRLKRGYWWQN
jgi:hypothetical protein